MAAQNPKNALPDWIAAHVRLYREDPQKGHLWDSTAVGGPGLLPTLLLEVTGRKSGKSRTVPLIYGKSHEDFVIIASKGGSPEHPAWYLNLQKNPECQIQVAEDHFRVRARTARGSRREALWQQLAAIYPPYEEYQARTSRKIPVVVLEVLKREA